MNQEIILSANEYLSLVKDRDRLKFLEGNDCYKWKCVATGAGGYNLCRVHVGGERTLREAIDKAMQERQRSLSSQQEQERQALLAGAGDPQ